MLSATREAQYRTHALYVLAERMGCDQHVLPGGPTGQCLLWVECSSAFTSAQWQPMGVY